MDLQRTFTFRNSKQTYTGIPIIAANMDTTGTFDMAKVFSKVSEKSTLHPVISELDEFKEPASTFYLQHTLFTAIQKHYSVEDWKNFAANHPECLEVSSPPFASGLWLFPLRNQSRNPSESSLNFSHSMLLRAQGAAPPIWRSCAPSWRPFLP